MGRRKILGIILGALVLGGCVTAVWAAHRTQRQLAEKMIRLHVIANSDSAEDQALKLTARDAVLGRAEAILRESGDMEAVAAALREALPELEAAARTALRAEGCGAAVSAAQSGGTYPTRVYESFRLPAGEYLSLQVRIGAAEGRNWWCVVFPPLCRAATVEEFSDAAGEAGLSEGEISLITDESAGVEMRFWLVDRIGSLWKARR